METNELERLSELVKSYSENKSAFDKLKKTCDTENSEIKSIMSKYDIPEYTFGDTVIKYSVQHRESMNEDMLLEIAHTFGIPEIVKTKEYIDFDALESAIYHNQIPQAVLLEMNKAKSVTEVPTLRISKKKEKKDVH